MKPLHNLYLYSLPSLIFFSISCKRDIPPLPVAHADLRSVTFTVSGFESEVTPFPTRLASTHSVPVNDSEIHALGTVEPSPEPQHLYYWSFNEETLEPDLAVDGTSVELAIEANAAGPDFVNGYARTPFEAGRALSIKGARSLLIHLPMAAIESLTDFSFDIKSSDTGPKDFSLSYSTDGGMSYEEVSASNPFEKTKSTQWNQYTFDIHDFAVFGDSETLTFKMDFLEGDRGEGSGYNESSGTVHLDNLRFSGIYNAGSGDETDTSMPSRLRYYVFSSEDGALVEQRELAMAELGEDGSMTIKLPEGMYDVLILAYRSGGGLQIPDNVTNANAFYFGQDFNDHRAATYAWLWEEFEVGDTDVSEPAVLTRCFSAVEFDFTDFVADLASVDRIDITRLHPNYVYTPFGEPTQLPDTEITSMTFLSTELTEGHRLAFHQFLGMPSEPREVRYRVTAYGEGNEELNTVVVNERVMNNVQLVFRGHLLGELSRFAISVDPHWGDIIEHGF